MSKSIVQRLSVMPKIDYTNDEMNELKQTFQTYDEDGSGYLTPRRAVKCISDLNYNFNESLILAILNDQSKDKVTLDFNDFVNFIDVIGAIDAYMVDHLNDLIQGLPESTLNEVYATTGVSDPQKLVQYLSGLVTLGSQDSFKFSAVYELLGYEDIDQPDVTELPPDLAASQATASKVPETPTSPPQRNQMKTDLLQVPRAKDESNGNVSSKQDQQPKPRNLSVRFDIDETKQFKLPKLSIPTTEEAEIQPTPLRTLNTNPKPVSFRFSESKKDEPLTENDEPVGGNGIRKFNASPNNGTDDIKPTEDVVSPSQALVIPSPVAEFDEEDIAYVHDAFATFLTVFDRDRDGAIAVSELGAALRMLGLDPSEEQIQDLFMRADVDRNGMIDFGEFCLYYKQMLELEFKDGVPLQHIKSMFAKADANNDGEVTREEFAHIIRKEFPNLSNTNIEELLEIADHNADGIIDFEEFVSFLTRTDKSSRVFARKLFRAHLPSPIQYLTAYAKMPSNFRPSALANLQHERCSSATSHVAPILDPDYTGLEFRDLRLAEGSTALAPIVGEICVQIELIGAEGIPIPVMNRHRIAARRARLALFSGDKLLSCQYVVRAHWNPQEEDRWKFAFPTSSMHILVAKSSQKQPFLLIELSLLVEDETKSSCSEMTCGFATIDLGGEMLTKVVTETVPVSGGTFKAKAAINSDEILARREGWRRLTSMFKGKPLPTISAKIGPVADTKQKDHTYRIPNNIIAPLVAVEVLHLFLEILSDATVRCARPFLAATSHPQQDVAIRIFLDRMVNNPDSLTALADAWRNVKKNLSRQAKRKLSPGTPNDFVKSEFRKTILRMWPALSSVLLPEPQVGQTDHERLSLLSYCAKEDTFEQFSSDGLANRANGAPGQDISKSLIFRPFHTDEIAFSYDMYQNDLNPFGILEREIRETCEVRD